MRPLPSARVHSRETEYEVGRQEQPLNDHAGRDWGNILFNTTIATAIADRLAENSEIFLLGGDSLRKAGIRQTSRIFAVRCGLFPSNAVVGAHLVPGLLPAIDAVVAVRRRPEGRTVNVPAGSASPATNPDPIALRVVSLLAPLSVAHDGSVARTGQRRGNRHSGIAVTPASVLCSGSGSAIKRITAGVKACR